MSANPVLSDVELERQIDGAFSRMVRAVQVPDQIKHWDEMIQLVRQRSPDQIKRMERERRLGRR